MASNLGHSNVEASLPRDSLYLPAEEALKKRAQGGDYAQMDRNVYAEKLVAAVMKGQTGQIWIGSAAMAARVGRWLPQGMAVRKSRSKRSNWSGANCDAG